MSDEIKYNFIMPEALVAEKLIAAKLTVATAESCTGGLVGNRITNISGSSAYFIGGVMSYANEIKQNVLGVPLEVLNSVGAVSQECALAMAQGVRKLMGTSIGISTTGIAGPGGATAGKPVGLVYIALCADGYERCEKFIWQGDRILNKEQSAEAALQILVDYLNGLEINARG
jgi:PncC family amidohydrolase